MLARTMVGYLVVIGYVACALLITASWINLRPLDALVNTIAFLALTTGLVVLSELFQPNPSIVFRYWVYRILIAWWYKGYFFGINWAYADYKNELKIVNNMKAFVRREDFKSKCEKNFEKL